MFRSKIKKIMLLLLFFLVNQSRSDAVTSLDQKGLEVTCNVMVSGPLPVLNQSMVNILDYDPRIIYTPGTKVLVKVYLATDYYGRLVLEGINRDKLYPLTELSNAVLYGGYMVEEGRVKRDSRILIHFSDGDSIVTSFTCSKKIDIDEIIRKDELDERIIVSGEDLKTRAYFPLGSLMEDARVRISRSDKFENLIAYDFQVWNASDNKVMKRFAKSIKLQIHYNLFGDNLIEKLNIRNDESIKGRLILSYYDGVQWMPVGGEVDTVSQVVSAWVDHFSLYAITFDDGRDFRIGPNPFTPNEDGINDEVVFSIRNSFHQTLNIRIYSIMGRLVRELEVRESPDPLFMEARWDGTDSRGKKSEDGLYIYQIKLGDRRYNGTVVLAK